MYKSEKLFVIAILGPAGVGKTTLAEFLKNQLENTAHVSSDHIKRYISQFKEVESHNIVSRNVTDAMVVEYLKNGISVIVEQGMNHEQLQKLEDIAKTHDAIFLVYKVEAHSDIRMARIAERAERTKQPVMSEKTINILETIYKENTYIPTRIFDSGIIGTEEIASTILEDLKVK